MAAPGLELLERALRSPLLVTRANRRKFYAGHGAKDEVITTCRFILILSGEISYVIEGNEYRFAAGTQFLIPSWCRRWWNVVEGGVGEIIWCEFDDDPKEISRGDCFARKLDGHEVLFEKRSYLQLLQLWAESRRGGSQDGIGLELEGQLKSMLGRFLPRAEMGGYDRSRQRVPLHPGVKQALRWIEDNFVRPDAVSRLVMESGLTPNYFRKRFREALGCSPGDYIKQLRFRRARYLLLETDWQHKRVAAEIGFSDPLYFSRKYREFWGHPPSDERIGVAAVSRAER